MGEPEQAGQGGAFGQFGGVKIAVFTVVNALSALVDRQGSVVRGNYDSKTGKRMPYLAGLEHVLSGGQTLALSEAEVAVASKENIVRWCSQASCPPST